MKVKGTTALGRVWYGKEHRPTFKAKFQESPFLAKPKMKLGFDSGEFLSVINHSRLLNYI